MADPFVTNEVKEDEEIIPAEQPLPSQPQLIANIQAGGNAVRVGPLDNVQAAINAMNEAGGGTVYLKSGRYVFTQKLVSYDNIHLVGENREATILDFSTGSGFLGTSGYGSNGYGLEIAGTLHYSSGSKNSRVAATNDSTSVVVTGDSGLGDAIVAAVVVGDNIQIDYEQLYEVAAIVKDSDTQATITLTNPYEGVNLTSAVYEIGIYKKGFSVQNLTIAPYLEGISLRVQFVAKFLVKDLNVTNSGSYADFDILDCVDGELNNISVVNGQFTVFESGNLRLSNIFNDQRPFSISQSARITVDHLTVRSSLTTGLSFDVYTRDCIVFDYFSDTNWRGLAVMGTRNLVLGGVIKNSQQHGIAVGGGTSELFAATECSVIGMAVVNNGTGSGVYYGIAVGANASMTTIGLCQLRGNDTSAINDLGTNTISANNQT